MKYTCDDYRGQPVNVCQGRKFEAFKRLGHSTICPLQFLHGRKWDNIALGYIHALRPTSIRVVNESIQLDSRTWRVTVFLEEDDETIMNIEQEVIVGLPDGIDSGYDLDCICQHM